MSELLQKFIQTWIGDLALPQVEIADAAVKTQEGFNVSLPGFSLNPGSSIEGDLNHPFQAIASVIDRNHPVPIVGFFENLVVTGSRFSVLADNGHLLRDAAYLNRTLVSHFTPLLAPDTTLVEKELSGDCVWIIGSSSSSNNYWHWTTQALPAIQHCIDFLEQEGINSWRILTRPLSNFQKQSLELLGIGPDSIHELQKFELAVTPRAAYSNLLRLDFSPSGHRGVIAKRFRHAVEIDSQRRPSRKTYFARTDVSRRKLVNETDLIEALENLGFSCFVPGELSVYEQVKVAAESEVIVGPHGAGMTNVLFASPGTKVLEIGRDSYRNAANVTLGMSSGVSYYLDIFKNSNGEKHSGETTVDISAVRATLVKMSGTRKADST